MTGQRIVMATFGSLGDLHPYIALGRELKRRGHSPAIATTDQFRTLVESNGIGFHAMRPAASQLGDPTQLMKAAFHPLRGSEFLIAELVMRFVRAAYEDLERATRDADLLITHPLAVAGVTLAEKKRMAWASSVLSPMSLMSIEEPPLFAPAPWLRGVRALGRAPYRALFGVIKALTRRWQRPLDALRADLGLPPLSQVAVFEGQYSSQLNLALFSGLLSQPATDWPANTVLCGMLHYDGPPPDRPTVAALEDFLAAGDAPVVFALGSSAVLIAGRFWDAAAEAMTRLGRRAIFITGTPLERFNSAAIRSFTYLPYSLLFARAAVLVHHAGMGTLAQALASGRPQLLVPLGFDQPDNAERAARLGVARIIPFAKASAGRIENALRELLEQPRYEREAGSVAMRARQENGAGRAAEAIEQLLASARPPS